MPPACARVVMTQRSIRIPIWSVASPTDTDDPMSSSSPSSSTMMFCRKRCSSQDRSVALETSETRAPGLSWNAPEAPSKADQELTGIVGGSGIGFLIFNSMQLFQYREVSMELIVLLGLLLVVERVSSMLRARIN